MEAKVHLEKQGATFFWVIDQCPYCGKRHTHGAGNSQEDARSYLGHRQAHCFSSDHNTSAGYTLIEEAIHE